MTVRPILFSGPMIKALLDGRKSQTRRVLKPQPPEGFAFLGIYSPRLTAVFEDLSLDARKDHAVRLPYAPGDLLWCRESLQAESNDQGHRWITYRADRSLPVSGHIRWDWQRDTLPSIHMPRWASRLTLRVIGVRVERLQDISEADAIAEGCWPYFDGENPELVPTPDGHDDIEMFPLRGPIDDFHRLWDSLNARRAPWDSNPWVAAASFSVIKANVDQVLQEAA